MPAIILNSYAPNLTPDQQHEWQDDALCAQVDPEIFFPEAQANYSKALAVCKLCDVVEQCLAYALKTEPPYRDRHGVFGNKTPNERRILAGEKIRKNYRKKKETTDGELVPAESASGRS